MTDDGRIWRITPFYSFYNNAADWNTHESDGSSNFETIAVTAESGPTDVFKFSEDSPNFKSDDELLGRDCDP